jgi:hypothetical protein
LYFGLIGIGIKKIGVSVKNTYFYSLGVLFYIAITLISLGIPAYLIHEWSNSVGSGSGLVFLLILPFSMITFIIGLIFFIINNKRKTINQN